jgi:metallophosphoesterase (TIGR00282 family)
VRLLLVGDVMGKPGRKALERALPPLVGAEEIDLVVVNGENSAGGLGITPKTAHELFEAGADAITTGNHVWKKREIGDYLAAEPRVIRPANFPPGAPGRGAMLVETKGGLAVGILNLQGRVFMEPIECPFRCALAEIEQLKGRTSIIVVDFHAEATSEKIAMGWFLDGKVSAVLGTHTHVQTSDERILPGGTAYLTDVGMTGSVDSVIGMRREPVLKRFLTALPQPFEVAGKNLELQGVIVDIGEDGKATAIRRVRRLCE